MCICWCNSPVELIDVLYVPKQFTHLLWANGEITRINNVGQVVLEKQQKLCIKGQFLFRNMKQKKRF